MRPSITSRETQYVPVRTIKPAPDYTAWFLDVLVSIVFTGLVLGILGSIFLLTDKAEAAEPVRQNDYYCQQIKDGSMRLVEPNEALTALCAKWGVSL